MGFGYNSKWLQTRIFTKTSLFRSQKDFCKCHKFGTFKTRSKKFIRKRCCRNCAKNTYSDRFLQHTFLSRKEKREVETRYKFTTTEPVSQETTLQNGYNDQGLKSSQERRLGLFSRFTRCLFTCTNLSKTSKIPKVCNRRNSVSVQSTMFRSNKLTSGIYKDSLSGGSTPEKTRDKISSIPRRLAYSRSTKIRTCKKSRYNHHSPYFSRFYNKHRKVRFNANTNNNIYRRIIQTRSRTSVSNSRENQKFENNNNSVNERSDISKTLFESSGLNSIMPRIDSQQSSVHETNSNALVTSLETLQNESRISNPMYTRAESSSSMVVVSSKYNERAVSISGVNKCNNHNRCLNDRLGGTFRDTNSTGPVVDKSIGITQSHKQSGVGSSIPNSQTFPSYLNKQTCTNSFRQYNSSTVHKQTRGDKIDSALQSDVESLEYGFDKQNCNQSSPHCGGKKYSSRSTKQDQSETNRMVSEQGNIEQNFSGMGVTNNRPFCLGSESQVSSVLCLGSRSNSTDTGCSINRMGQDVCLCLPTSIFNSESVATHDRLSMRNDSDSSLLAKTMVVSTVNTVTDSTTPSITSMGKSIRTRSGKIKNISSKSRDIQPDCMANIDKQFETKGFSENTRKLLSASWRAGTHKDYKCKFRQFSSWCDQRKIDPYVATLEECANFLASLFDKGLKYRTIAGYRSMLSSVLAPVDKTPVGQHPYIIRLLKGVFNSRPPERKLLPEWDLPLVLDMFKKPPFAPMKFASLKHLTWKTAFLIAITSFRRCSDLQSLKLGEGSVNIQEKGVTFLRHGLAKQDRANHDNSKIFIPAFPESKLLDPKRTLYMYLKRTDKLRQNGEKQEFKLFLSTNKPHKPVTAQTISHWIVKTIKMAYKQNKKQIGKVRGHSTRSVGPSWALFKGASMKNVLDSADWAKSTTFTKFYLKDVNVNFLNL